MRTRVVEKDRRPADQLKTKNSQLEALIITCRQGAPRDVTSEHHSFVVMAPSTRFEWTHVYKPIHNNTVQESNNTHRRSTNGAEKSKQPTERASAKDRSLFVSIDITSVIVAYYDSQQILRRSTFYSNWCK